MPEYIEREAIKALAESISRNIDPKFPKEAVTVLANFLPAADVVPMDFHERCLEIEIKKRMELEREKHGTGGLTMRLIDADALMKYIEETHPYGCLPMAAHICTMELLTYAPTIEAEPVKHGEWVEWWPPKHMILTGEEMLYRCSVCDAKYPSKENMRFCPYCGAKMNGGADNA